LDSTDVTVIPVTELSACRGDPTPRTTSVVSAQHRLPYRFDTAIPRRIVLNMVKLRRSVE